MGKHIQPEKRERILAAMFAANQDDHPACSQIREELSRYAPELSKASDEELRSFMEYHTGIYLHGEPPRFGRPIASPNPVFIDGTGGIEFERDDCVMYVRASEKVNGYRFQLHNGPGVCRAFTRQFTPYDLRMFPDLADTIKRLPVMIGDAEIANHMHRHLAGFNRVQMRIPAKNGFWPKDGQTRIDDGVLKSYLADPRLFKWNAALPDMRLTLVFHGMFAIAHPSTWSEPPRVQAENMISLARMPIDYLKVDWILDELAVYLRECDLNARVVDRKVIFNRRELDAYVAEAESRGEEGVCVVRSGKDSAGRQVAVGRSVKIKKYEPIDMALLGLYLKDPRGSFVESNISGAVFGLYDESLGTFLAATKANLDPQGVQVKTPGQKERLIAIRRELASLVSTRLAKGAGPEKILTLMDAFLRQGAVFVSKISDALGERADDVSSMLGEIPRGKDIVSLYERFVETGAGAYRAGIKKPLVADKFILRYLDVFDAVSKLEKAKRNRFLKYFARFKDIKATSAKLVQPDVLVDPHSERIVVEMQIFDIKWADNPFPAGYHSWFGNSFHLTNCFPDHIRFDKATTTSYETVYRLAHKNTVRKPRLRPKRRKR